MKDVEETFQTNIVAMIGLVRRFSLRPKGVVAVVVGDLPKPRLTLSRPLLAGQGRPPAPQARRRHH